MRGRRAAAKVTPAGNKHDPSRDRAAISYHYNVGNEFYQLWLDRRLVYSCAYFQHDDDTLDKAQEAKLDLVCRKLRLQPGERFLDIGCGWGALVLHATSHYGVRATGVTLSTEQAELSPGSGSTQPACRTRAASNSRLPQRRAALGPFDKMASVGMVEHVGVDHLAELLRVGVRRARSGWTLSQSRDRKRASGASDELARVRATSTLAGRRVHRPVRISGRETRAVPRRGFRGRSRGV